VPARLGPDVPTSFYSSRSHIGWLTSPISSRNPPRYLGILCHPRNVTPQRSSSALYKMGAPPRTTDASNWIKTARQTESMVQTPWKAASSTNSCYCVIIQLYHSPLFATFRSVLTKTTSFWFPKQLGHWWYRGADLNSRGTRKLYANHSQSYCCVLQTPLYLPHFALHAGQH